MTKNKPTKKESLDLGLVLAIIFTITTILISFYFQPLLPEKMITHWGLYGEANGYSSKEIGLAIFPLISIAIVLLLYFLPLLDPMKKNIEEFKKEYHKFIAVLAGFFLYLQIITIALNLGLNANIGQLLSPAFAVLIICTGIMLGKAKRNYFIGIRTPWTLNSEENWNKTHALGKKLFIAAGIISLIGVIIPNYAIIFLIAPILIASICTIIYSYKEFLAQKNKVKKG